MTLSAFRPVIAAAAVVLAACGSSAAQSLPAVSPAPRPVAGGAYPADFVASASGGGGSAQGLAVFSSSDGRLLRWPVRSRSLPVPVAVSPGGRWVYYYYPAAPQGRCPRNGFTEPVLWRVPVGGGRPQRAGISTTNLAFSPDGTIVAYTSARRCGRTLLIVVRNQRTGATRRIVAAHNDLSGTRPIFYAQLSWAPDDVHLAVAVAPAAAINTLEVVNARRATDITQPSAIAPCAARQAGCLDPGYDTHGRLTFLQWRQAPSLPGKWVVRWQNGHATRLFRLSQTVSFHAAIAVDRTGNAILLEGYLRYPEIWRWSGGSLALVRRSTRQLAVTSPLWLSH